MSFLVNSYRYLAPDATLTADAGTFTLTGVSASFARALKLAAAKGDFALTGQNVGLSTGIPDLVANSGTFTLTGNAAALSRALRMAASSGSFALTGNAAALNKALTLLASGGSFTLTGLSNAFRRALVMAAAQSTFTLTGNAATLTYGVIDPNFSSVKLLLGFEGTDGATTTTDESSAPHTMTFNGNAQIDTAQKKFGASSLLVDGTGDFLTSVDSADWDFGSGQFTVEMFIRQNTDKTNIGFVGQWSATTGSQAWFLFLDSGTLRFRFVNSGGTTRDTGAAWNPTTGVWYHLAADRDATGKVRTYVDGVMHASATWNETIRNTAVDLSIGRVTGFATYDLDGWIDELRITKGVARYASDGGFTVPTAAFPRS
ncbi:LamG domain-containing protein [Rhizobium ruizarguesonis]|uniref:LamG domain-containing protein n=1 Tax=Rhizobium ruizarguesonis TaxID=2081791 RepID=UPI0010311A8E|nr:LamG domain-containing protein [Rhizobium ruizarguesonis]MBY5849685.1 LamG domain-containing protein [Rhizobium leguminosarum]TBA59241.1 LamG domain-containing protein [Rhizobium ruizarguesonis]